MGSSNARRVKSQSAVEFISLASFMLLVIFGFFAITSSSLLNAKEEGDQNIASDIADLAFKEIETARSVNDGYYRVFSMPETINGADYMINITDNRELTVNYLGYEYVKFLPPNVVGNISKGLIKISRSNGIVHINATSVQLPSLLTELMMKGSGINAISFLSDGSVILKGTLSTQASPVQNPLANQFVVKAGNAVVAVIDLDSGNMAIKGNLFRNQASLSPSASDNFIVKNSQGSVISYIDNAGNFYLKKTLSQNTNP